MEIKGSAELNWLLKNKQTKISCSWRNQPADELRIKIKEQYGLDCCTTIRARV
jgi:hypothetical protein